MCHIFSTHFSILFGLKSSHSLPGSPFHRQHVLRSTWPPQICIWRSGGTNCPCLAASSVSPLWDGCFRRPVLMSPARVLAALSLQEVTRLRRTHPWIVFPGWAEEAAGVWGSGPLLLALNVSWESRYRWAPRSPSAVPLSLLLSALRLFLQTLYFLINSINLWLDGARCLLVKDTLLLPV